ncbi:cytoplasmic protein [Moraxella nasovis]|uniref:cytoplasmic protein n=1 Tax=Moraxella nasovis TaxID=2904121 RepID=UPI001F618C43|nr:cytoplasmic protein [Moraxella nasovis]UNU72982.1 cytoplasmic protein [Moraxella nasovis]
MKSYPIFELKALHGLCTNHRNLLKKYQQCACFHCLTYFDYSDIQKEDWIDNNDTALCPYCGIDAVLPNDFNNLIEENLLKTMQKYFFS